ncbi:hypothetical protein CEXT_67441 [Caerostris extrusa]|uniref:Uncharacterized protein n=1 Tax=Caerostris extrusa TaxID=172846 RepID=A0AAV4XU01_CAEEX|nr:hypothetical protein CEXT_67441 [Caerostris extrusa]
MSRLERLFISRKNFRGSCTISGKLPPVNPLMQDAYISCHNRPIVDEFQLISSCTLIVWAVTWPQVISLEIFDFEFYFQNFTFKIGKPIITERIRVLNVSEMNTLNTLAMCVQNFK